MTDGAGVLRFLSEREAELVEFARELIATPSPNPPGDERAVAALARDRLRQLGVVDVDVVGKADERPNVIARVAGARGGRTLVLSGHLDTKPPGDLSLWATDPWDPVIRDGLLYGVGSGDMKAAVAAMVYAAGALAATECPPGELTLVLTADEEAGSVFGARWLAESGLLAGDAAIVGEPCGVSAEWEAIDLVSRGAALFRIRVRGTQLHSSLSDRLPAVNATVLMSRLVDRMHRELKQHLTYEAHPLSSGGPTVNVGVTAQAGIYYGVYPGQAEFACDVRTLPGMTWEQLEADLEAFVARVREDEPDLDAEIELDGWFPATEIAAGHPVVEALADAARTVLGAAPPFDAFPGATDAVHLQLTAGIPTVAAFGPGLLSRAHSPNECVAVASIPQAAAMYALAATRYLAG